VSGLRSQKRAPASSVKNPDQTVDGGEKKVKIDTKKKKKSRTQSERRISRHEKDPGWGGGNLSTKGRPQRRKADEKEKSDGQLGNKKRTQLKNYCTPSKRRRKKKGKVREGKPGK